MHILITDSGVGGLSVVAYAERFVRTHGAPEPVRLTFANAAPANDYGYNSMPSHAEKIETFDRFLRNVTERFEPDFIYVACNTLSVLLPETPYSWSRTPVLDSPLPEGVERTTLDHNAQPPVPVKGIVETATDVLMDELSNDPRTVAMIFATQTTIDAGTYPRLLEARGVAPQRIVSQACPGLADTISEDRDGARSAAEIGCWVGSALEGFVDDHVPVVASLNCTHYGYRRDLFAAAFAERGIAATVVNPNERAVDDLFPPGASRSSHDVEVRFVTRYAIPAATIEALSFFLGEISPKTVEALRAFEHDPALF